MPKTRVVCVGCEVFSRQLYLYAALSERYIVDVVLLPRDLHNHPPMLRRMIQEQIDKASKYDGEPEQQQQTTTTTTMTTRKRTRRGGHGAGTGGGGGSSSNSMGPYGAVLVAFGVCGGGTTGLVCRGVPVAVLNREDCAAILLGSCERRAAECRKCPGTWYCHRGDVERRAHGSSLQDITGLLGPTAAAAAAAASAMTSGSGNEEFLRHEMEKIVRSYTRLLYIRASGEEKEKEEEDSEEAAWARSQAEANEWAFEEVQGTDELLRRLLCGDWKDSDDFVVMTKANEETELVQVGDRMVLRVKEAQK